MRLAGWETQPVLRPATIVLYTSIITPCPLVCVCSLCVPVTRTHRVCLSSTLCSTLYSQRVEWDHVTRRGVFVLMWLVSTVPCDVVTFSIVDLHVYALSSVVRSVGKGWMETEAGGSCNEPWLYTKDSDFIAIVWFFMTKISWFECTNAAY